ncbi:zinc finger protein 2 [Electrophorus electricus]|uniref:C2H2-type domain-containing protein n=1 Tax=Electrophorus electricus TaxID=8005 RepID=A0A4W4GG90_ELEEL|nr:zinc finger protein 2 [Electrophorus electricus]XP_026863040.2 zinc finger protein 2 [Electrophorus electricus]XP_026863041.2 zinc finger protein 2 [Electrophorus electricus]XP_026863042.2 zinc finger protein 2 [Electrophorus electricus]XP_026863044.2 zinc finger protein 2 [Electrophorus electricus]
MDMANPLLDFSYPQASTGDDFICAECGEGFGQYPKLINHMASHGPIDPISSNNESTKNGYDTPIEFALHENGTLTVVDRSALSNFSFLFGKSTSKPVWSQTSNQDSLPLSKISEREHTQCRCERCGQVFRTQRSLQQHQRYRPLEQGFKCTLCCKIFYDRESLRGHLQNHAHERFYSCGHCGKRFLKQETMLLHQKEWHGSYGSKSSNKLEEDRENGMDRSYPCKICGLRFFWLSDLQSHLINHSNVVKPNEDNGQKENMREQDESSHKKNVSYPAATVDRSYRCGLCGGCFDCLSDLKKHHLSEHPDDECDEGSSKLTRHLKWQPVNYYGIMRQMVSKHQMQRLDTLRPRMRGRPRGGANRSNHNSKVFPCKQCHRVFVHSSSLSRHMRYHKGTLHTCLYCGKHFPQRCDVTRHVAMYHISDIKIKNECELLQREDENGGDESSKRQESNDMDDHGSQENDQQPPKPQDDQILDTQEISFLKPRITYKCKECGRVFGLLSVYQRHVRYHRRDPSRVLLSCPRCPCRFTFRSALDRHLENHDKEGSERNGRNISPEADDDKEYLENEDQDLGVESASEADSKEGTSAEVLYECTECTQTFSDLQIFLQHQSAHG